MSTKPKEVLVIDGGFATQLTVHVGKSVDGDPLWSARFNATNPNAVLNTHLDFLQNGADAIITNTYQASVEGYMEYLHLDEEQSIDLIKQTVMLAHKARSKFLSDDSVNHSKVPLVVASIGPFGAHLHDGSEYTGCYAEYVNHEIIKKWHRTRIDACIDACVDALAVETLPCAVSLQKISTVLYR